MSWYELNAYVITAYHALEPCFMYF